MVVRVSRHGSIAVVTVHNPPVNAASQAVRQGLLDALERTEADAYAKAVVLACAGRTFIAGADVREFGKPPVKPHLPDLLARIECASKPWVAAIHGSALGGGLEAALVCSHRIATASAILGLPEVSLGLIPGAGGTARLPRLVPADKALAMIATGKPVTASEAEKIGLIDAIAEGDLPEEAIALAQRAASEPLRTPLAQRAPLKVEDGAAFEAAAEKIEAKAGQQHAPRVAVRAVRNALERPADVALAAERKAFLALKADPQSRALRHVFFAERATTRIERLKTVRPRFLREVGVIGGGTMGAGIAAACLLSGYSVTMVERDSEAASAGEGRVKNVLDGSLQRGLISASRHASLLAEFNASDGYDALSSVDLAIEAVFENMDVKKEVFANLDAHARPDSVLATNTSYLDVNEIANSSACPGRVIGLHFFSPAHIMKLLEIVVTDAASNEILATGVAFAKSLKKVPVLAGVCDGFIANRIMSAYRREAECMLEDGALPWEVDAAMTDFGLPMGLFQMQDLAGLDISWAMRKQQAATRDPDQRYVDIGDKLCEMGRFGRKTGRGYYLYGETGHAIPDPEVEALILSESARKGIVRQRMTRSDIMARILEAMQTEGSAILDEGIARCGDDIDVVMINAYGFPRWKGGPMFMKGQRRELQGERHE